MCLPEFKNELTPEKAEKALKTMIFEIMHNSWDNNSSSVYQNTKEEDLYRYFSDKYGEDFYRYAKKHMRPVLGFAYVDGDCECSLRSEYLFERPGFHFLDYRMEAFDLMSKDPREGCTDKRGYKTWAVYVLDNGEVHIVKDLWVEMEEQGSVIYREAHEIREDFVDFNYDDLELRLALMKKQLEEKEDDKKISDH